MFPETSSPRETSGLEGIQELPFSSGPYIKCILFNASPIEITSDRRNHSVILQTKPIST